METAEKTLRKRLRGRDLMLDVSANNNAFTWTVRKVSAAYVAATGFSASEDEARSAAEEAARKFLDLAAIEPGGWYSVVH